MNRRSPMRRNTVDLRTLILTLPFFFSACAERVRTTEDAPGDLAAPVDAPGTERKPGEAEPVKEPIIAPGDWFRGHPEPDEEGRTRWASLQGNDEWEGSRDAPFRTVSHALSGTEPGDTIRLGPGLFREQVVVTRSGTPDAPITIRGALDADGNRLTRITTGVPVSPDDWIPAPEVGPGVYKNDRIPFPVGLLTLDDRQVAPIHERADNVGSGQPRRYSAWEVLAWPEGHRVPAAYEEDGLDFWAVIQAVYHLHQDEASGRQPTVYLRLADGRHPGRHRIEAFRAGSVVTYNNAAYHALRDVEIAGGDVGIRITGTNARFNEVNNCRILFGTDRLEIVGGASNNVVRDSRFEMLFLGHPTGAWAGGAGHPEAPAKRFVYRYFKYWASRHGTSDDRSLTLHDCRDNLIWRNTLDGGLIGISLLRAESILIQQNRVTRHSSVGTSVREGCSNIQVDANRFEDNSINFRLHNLNVDRGRDMYLTRNISVLPAGLGNHIFCHVITAQAPIATDPPLRAVFAHNTFLGGNAALRLPIRSHAEDGLPEFVLVNNLFALGGAPLGGPRWRLSEEGNFTGIFAYNLVIRSAGEHEPPPWFGPGARVAATTLNAWGLPVDGAHLRAGIDLRNGFELGGRRFEPIPNLRDDYFHGPRPDIGAVQSH